MKTIRVSDEFHKKLMQIQVGVMDKTGEKIYFHNILEKLLGEKVDKYVEGLSNGH